MEIPKYKFDKIPRWFKEIAQYDEEIAKWNIYKYMVMRESIELSLRFGNPFGITLTKFGQHIKTERHAVSRYLTQLAKEEWLKYTAGKYTNHSAVIEVNWDKLNGLYETNKARFKTMVGKQKSGIGNTAVGKQESGIGKQESGIHSQESGIGSANKESNKRIIKDIYKHRVRKADHTDPKKIVEAFEGRFRGSGSPEEIAKWLIKYPEHEKAFGSSYYKLWGCKGTYNQDIWRKALVIARDKR